ncbi:MAG: ATP--guanido phosphotransferase [Lachnospiraceae bacterium]|nr:ATP--guanido phosphotransferase [Lachnospiraceae bacterium]
MAKWYDVPGNMDSNVVYSRIRLVRNWADYPFPGKMTREQSLELTGQLCERIKDVGSVEGLKIRYGNLHQITDLEKRALLERRVINRSLVKKSDPAGLFLSDDERVSIAINGDDHIRIQAIEKGLNLSECYRIANAADDYISEQIEYSFDEKYGYLTAFPTNVGTGLRASVIVHLPMLSRKKNFNSLVADMGRFGTIIRGVFGEGSENYGSLYQVSNQKTLGQTEKDIVDLVYKAAAELDAQERRLRKEALKQRPVACADECYKSYGVLKYARRLTGKDSMEFLSQIMAGVTDGILVTDEPCSIYSLVIGSQPANLLGRAERPLSKEELEVARADFLREKLPEIH